MGPHHIRVQSRASLRLRLLCIFSVVVWMGVSSALAQYPSGPQISKDGTALLLQDYASVPLSSLTTGAYPPPIDFTGQLSRVNFLRSEPVGVPSSPFRFFVSDSNRNLYLLDRTTRSFTTYLNFEEIFPKFVNPPFSGGLITFAFGPDYATSGTFYSLHMEDPARSGSALPSNASVPGLNLSGYSTTAAINPPVGTAVRQAILVEWIDTNINNTTFEGTAREVLRLGFNNYVHPAGDIVFNPLASTISHPDYGNAYISIGDGKTGELTDARHNIPQRLDALPGKIIRITPNTSLRPGDLLGENGRYRIPATGSDPNPFVSLSLAGVRKEIYAYGFRHPDRLSWDIVSNTLIVNDIGQDAWEEVNLATKGANYGYAEREGPEQLFIFSDGQGTTGSQTSPPTLFPNPDTLTVDGLAQPVVPAYPVVVYSHRDGDAMSSGFVYRGSLIPQLYGEYVFGDITTGRIFHSSLTEMLTATRTFPAAIHEIQVAYSSPYDTRGVINRRMYDIVADAYAHKGGDPNPSSSQGVLPGWAPVVGGGSPFEPGLLDIEGVRYGGGRADTRVVEGGDGEIYILSKSDGMIRSALPLAAVNAPPTVATPASASPNPVTATTTNLSVLGADDGGEANLIYTWATMGSPPAAVSFSVNGTNAAKNVVATFAKAGSYSFQVTIRDQGNLTTSSSVNVTVNATVTSISVAPSSATVSAGGTQQFSATAWDQFGVALSPQPAFSWAVSGGGSINTAGLFTAGTTAGGPYTVTASSGGITSIASVTVMALPVLTYVQGAGTTNDASSSLIAQAFTTANVSGNLIVAAISWGSNASVTCSDSQGNSYAVATTQYDSINNQSLAICYAANVKGGANTVTATLSSSAPYRRLLIHEYYGIARVNPLDVVAKNLANGTTTANGITSTAAVTTASGDLIFAAVMDDAAVTTITAGTGFTQRQSVNNKDLASEDLMQLTAGSIAATHTFGTADRYLAQMAAFKAGGSAPPNAPPTVATPASASPNPVTATTTNLSVLGADDGGEANLIYTWATTGLPPAAVSFSVNGTNAAKNVVATFAKAGSYTFRATIQDAANLSVTSDISVTVNQTLTSIAVTPASASVVPGGSQPFSATAADQFGAALTAQPSFTWGVNGGGVISGAGVFTAGGAAGGPFTVTASSGGKSGNATVTVTSAVSAPAFVQGAALTDDSGSATIARAFTSANAAGNLIVVAVSWGNNSAVSCSDSLGNTYAVATTQYDSTNNQSLAICYAANVKAGANTLTARFAASAAYRRLLIHEYRGVALVSPLDVVAKNLANGTTTANAITSTAATTTASGDLIFGAVMDDAGVTTVTAGTGFTQRLSVNNKDLVSEDQVQTTAGSIAVTFTFGASHRYLAQFAAFRRQ